MKSLQVIDFLIFAKIIIVMVKKMLFLRLEKCGQEWPERPVSDV